MASLRLGIVLLLISSGNSLAREGYFNGSSYVRLQASVNIFGHTGLSFRTCNGGELFFQENLGNELSLYVEAGGSLTFTVNLANGHHYVTRISAMLVNSMWYTVNLLYHMGSLTLSVSNHTEVVANSTHNQDLLINPDVFSNDSVLYVGRSFIGCILEGPNIIFNTSQVTSHNVEWGPCPLNPKSCTVPDHCSSDPCIQHGVCVSHPVGHSCHCYPRYGGNNCEIDKGPPCSQNDSNPCQNSGHCEEDTVGNYSCTCAPRFTGRNCEYEMSLNPCDPSPCKSGSTCVPVAESYQCHCLPGFTGINCETNINECSSEPCQNGGICQDEINNYTCNCYGTGYSGRNCENNINECEKSPCVHGKCFDNYSGYTCQCNVGYFGINCNQEVNECTRNPCHNNGLCSSLPGSYSCQCLAGFTGRNCEVTVTNCEDMICPIGTTCNINHGIAQCVCEGGLNCSAPVSCGNIICRNGGTCNNGLDGFVCNCAPGYTGKTCELSTDSCIVVSCMNGGTCMPSGECACPPAFTGPMCLKPLQCTDNPCIYADHCIDDSGSYTCICKPGWMGQNCDTRCCADGDCIDGDPLCLCGAGEQCQTSLNSCSSSPCKNGGVCQNEPGGYVCICSSEFLGQNCEQGGDPCSSSPCQHNGVCIPNENNTGLNKTFECQCSDGFTGKFCETSAVTCENKICVEPKVCVLSSSGPECQCPLGFSGSMCLERTSGPRTSGPCGLNPGICNNGVCHDKANGYQCFCQPGFSGDHCTIDIDECLSIPCKNNATCLNQINGYNCSCAPGFTGKDCNDNINECDDSPCQHGSTCVDIPGSYNCICLPGLTGKDCEINIDDCESNPCQNNGTCVDDVNSYQCDCTNTGFEGAHCERNVDDCASSPCKHGGTCNDLTNNYTCQCHPGYEGMNCEIDVPECDSSPCENGGTCQEYSHLYNDSSSHLYNPDWNYENASGFMCLCPVGITGERCETNINECSSNPCMHGECKDKINGYFCQCYGGYEGDQCETAINECERYEPCGSHGNCTDTETGYTCECDPKYGGKNCSVELLGCINNPCHNNGTCTPYLENEEEHKYNCTCSKGFHGDMCEMITTMSLTENSRIEIVTDREEGYDIQFLFKTTLPNCLLASGKGLTLYTLVLLGGRLNLQTSLLLNKWEGVFIGSGLNNGSWQRVFVQINTTHVVLAADQEQTIHPILPTETTNTSYTSFPVTHMGTAFTEVRNIVRGPFVDIFVGCVEDVVVNGKWVIVEDKPPNSTIENVTTGCSRQAQCFPNPCKSGGLCTDKWNDFRCACARPYLGHTCQYNITAATFGHESASVGLVEVTLTSMSRKSIRHVMDISMFIRTRMEKGAIFYMTSNSSQETVIAAQLENGELSVSILLNRTLEYYVVGGVRLSDGNNHLIEIIRNVTLMQVKINGTEYFRKTISASGYLEVQQLYLGGFPLHAHNKKNKRQVSETFQNSVMCDVCYFKGIIQDVQIFNGSTVMVVEFFPLTVPDLNIPPQFGHVEFNETSVLKGVQSDNTCRSNPCKEHGDCEETWNDFRCKCNRGYKGKMCEEIEFCQLWNCPAGSTCRNLENGFECLANVTFNGSNNSLHYVLKDIYEGRPSSQDSPLNSISIQYRSKFGGTLLYIATLHEETFFSLSIQNPEITISWKLHVGDKEQKEHFRIEELDDSLWKTLVLHIQDNQITGGYLGSSEETQNFITISNFPMESWNILVRNGDVYVGGPFQASSVQHTTNAENLSVVSVNTVTESMFVTPRSDMTYETSLIDQPLTDMNMNFKGCIGEIRIGNLLLSFLTSAQLNNANLTNKHQFSLLVDSAQDLELGCTLCFDVECDNGGKCKNATELYTCICPPGFEGDYCKMNIDECINNACQNNATCVDGINNYTCECAIGWTGSKCEIEIDECETSPCQNEGTCIDLVGYFECVCPEEYMGTTCELTRLLTCENSPCRGGSTCSDIKNPKTGDNFTCICTEGYAGVRCDEAFCKITPCINGLCVEDPGIPVCKCSPGFTGTLCEENIDDCADKPCHAGVCIDQIDSFSCNCSGTGYEGRSCEVDIDECISPEYKDQCGSNGKCVNLPGSHTCECSQEFCGIYCHINNPCLTKPCQNDGICIPTCKESLEYSCNCTTGHGGLDCTEVSTAESSSPADIAVIVTPIVGILLILMAIGVSIFISMARKKRATRGTYSPSQQEYCNPRVELDNVMKPPPEERLI